MRKDDDFFDLVKSETGKSEVEMKDIDPNEYFIKAERKGANSAKKILIRPKSGYLFPTTRSRTNPMHQALFNMQYFNDSKSSLNKSFIESEGELEEEISSLSLAFKISWIVISLVCNSSFVVLPNYLFRSYK